MNMAQSDRFENRYGVRMKHLIVTIPLEHHGKLIDLAKGEQTSLSTVVRTLIKQRVEHL